MRHIGVDPGIGGAIALIKNSKEIRVVKTPTVIRKIAGRKKKTTKDYDIVACREILKKYTKGKHKIYIEGVHPLLASKVANFGLGRSRGIWEGLVIGMGLKYELISPQTWKNYFFPLKDRKRKKEFKKKKAAVKLVKKLYPETKKYLKLVKDSDKADAILIAEMGRRRYGARNNKGDRN